MYRVAVKFSSTFGRSLLKEDGTINGENSGVTLLKRVLGLFPDPILVIPDDEPLQDGPGFEGRRLSRIDVNDTVLVNFDVIDSLAVYRSLKSLFTFPKIVNFVWFNVDEYGDKVNRAEMALSLASFPTFCNSQRTSEEVLVDVGKFVSPAHRWSAVVDWANLGIKQPMISEVGSGAEPRVLYPSMYLFARKRPDWWFDIVGTVAAKMPLHGRMALNDTSLGDERVAKGPGWLSVTSLVPREAYWTELTRDTAFVATAENESYGLQYLEALWAGQVGLFPDRPWARALLPKEYPLIYQSRAQAKEMLLAALLQPTTFRHMASMALPWIQEQHQEATFDRKFTEFVLTAHERSA